MLKTVKHDNLMVVNLTENVSVSTKILKENHAALRSGFVGCPPNPRWNATKFCAWRTGRQWRTALAQGTMMVRAEDCMLVQASEKESCSDDELPGSSRTINFFQVSQQLPNLLQIA
ncbi:hypothetical protein Sta7437_1311 [Stanieria cyanosphaera PCC 7437]|uniref:Uncharacterized protein n=1 Tax=Stanieria cyanosphaera (strain ATCC 29371 / PCC 7437) TaxID=111780 RepID=K9XQS4_STAC7|nr:hypothetical protein [Stanieria cyanosphaera]AFZ34878.1 hypothetical protein Sta7437_1311 [Stanieria cyanosphaera PCC 7437]